MNSVIYMIWALNSQFWRHGPMVFDICPGVQNDQRVEVESEYSSLLNTSTVLP